MKITRIGKDREIETHCEIISFELDNGDTYTIEDCGSRFSLSLSDGAINIQPSYSNVVSIGGPE